MTSFTPHCHCDCPHGCSVFHTYTSQEKKDSLPFGWLAIEFTDEEGYSRRERFCSKDCAMPGLATLPTITMILH